MSKFSIFNSKNLFVSLSILLIFLLLQPITVTYVAGATSSWSDVEFEVTDVVWGNSDYLQDPNPGDNSVPLTITIMISNLRSPNYLITGVIGTLTVNSDEFTNSTGGTVQTQAVAGSYKLGKEITFNFILNIDEDLVIGAYTPILTVKSVIDTTSTVLLTDDMILNIPLEVLGRPDLTFKSTFNNNEAELTITNIGPGTANSVDLSFDGGVIISEDSNWNITKLDKNESKSFKFNLSAISSNIKKFFPLSIPLPPEIIISAAVNSGLSDLLSAFLTNLDNPGSSSFLIFVIFAFPPFIFVASKLVVLIVIIFLLSVD